jgi:universal stress protein E
VEALRNILVLMEPGKESQPAFDAALLLARRAGARLELLVTDYQDLQAAYVTPPAALDHQLLDSAAALAALLGGEVHALHVFSIPAPVTVVGDAYVAAAAVPPAASGIESATTALRDLLAGHSIPAARGQLKIGSPPREILAQAAGLDAGLVVMGAVSRGRLDRWFVGNTAEAVLDRLACSVWIEKPLPA